ncbi:restriction endonuclease subunit S [Paenibacillus larvae]|nr:restriction endonuclease subunit S [Paenibacillus larvae]
MAAQESINPSKPKLNFSDQFKTSFLPMSSIDPVSGQITFIKEREFSKVSKGYTYFQENDILFAKITPCMENGNTVIAKGMLNKFGFGSTEFYVLRPSNIVEGRFIYYLLRSEKFRKEAKAVMSGAVGQQRVPKKFLIDYPLCLPPLNEQKRIADKIESLFAKMDIAKRLIDEAKESFELRRAAILDKAFRGELTKEWRLSQVEILPNLETKIPYGWKHVILSDVVQVNPRRTKLQHISDEQECTFVPMGAVSEISGTIEEPEVKSFVIVKKGYTYFEENDIIFAKITPCMENGKTALASKLINGFGFGSTEFHVIRAKQHINNKYIYFLLRSSKFRYEAKMHMTGAVGQQRVPKSFLENYKFQLPPVEEQAKIVDLLEKIYDKEDKALVIEQLEESIKLLKQSIVQKAFRRELGTNDSTEESAIQLLIETLLSQMK